MLQSPSFKFSRKASSSYSLKLEPPNKQKFKTKRKPLSTPASPSRAREPQCTCMTAEQYARLRAQDPRYRGEFWLFSKVRFITEAKRAGVLFTIQCARPVCGSGFFFWLFSSVSRGAGLRNE